MAKRQLSRDQKRKAKLAQRAKRREPAVPPYEGRKYQSDAWIPHVFRTERGIYDIVLALGDRLSNRDVQHALEQLVIHLQKGHPVVLDDAELAAESEVATNVELVMHGIRRQWVRLFQEFGLVHRDDLIGICRTLLYSIEAHRSISQGYINFLKKFMARMPDYPTTRDLKQYRITDDVLCFDNLDEMRDYFEGDIIDALPDGSVEHR